jgi:hypothetical protein
MKTLGTSILFAALVFVAAARAADIDGRWKGAIQGPDGDMQLTFTFHADGETLGGSVEGPAGSLDITNGTIKGDHITFNVVIDSANTITHEGDLKGDTIDMKSHGPWGDATFSLSRVRDQ